jgi:hypothetical protein
VAEFMQHDVISMWILCALFAGNVAIGDGDLLSADGAVDSVVRLSIGAGSGHVFRLPTATSVRVGRSSPAGAI